MRACPLPAKTFESEPILLLSLRAVAPAWRFFDLTNQEELIAISAAAREVWMLHNLRFGKHSPELTEPFLDRVSGILTKGSAHTLSGLVKSWTYRKNGPVASASWVRYLKALSKAQDRRTPIPESVIARVGELTDEAKGARRALGDVLRTEAAATPVDDVELTLHAEHFIYFQYTHRHRPAPIYDTLWIAQSFWWDVKIVGAITAMVTQEQAQWLYEDCRRTLHETHEAARRRAEDKGLQYAKTDPSLELPPLGESVLWR